MLITRSGRALFFIIMSALLLATPAISSPFKNIQLNNHNNSSLIPAQLNVEIGGSSNDVVRRLRRAGYSQIRIVKKSFLKIRAEACLGPDKYKVSVKKLGMRISRGSKIGTCAVEVSLEEIISRLRRDGYSRIDATEGREGNYLVRVCERGRKSILVIDRFGKTLRTKNIGRCRRGADFSEVRLMMRDEGYNRVRLIERGGRNGRGYIVEACRRGTKYRVTVSRRGTIRRERRIGRCTPPIDPSSIDLILEKRGFDRIRVTDRRLPGYGAEACRGNTRMSLRINRYGDIVDSSVIGDCRPPLKRSQLVSLLQKRGANRIKVEKEGRRGFVATACYRLEKIRYYLDAYGETVRQTVIGRCTPPPRLSQVLKEFRQERKLDEAGIFVEGCRKGTLLRFRINRFGEVIKREKIGRCR